MIDYNEQVPLPGFGEATFHRNGTKAVPRSYRFIEANRLFRQYDEAAAEETKEREQWRELEAAYPTYVGEEPLSHTQHRLFVLLLLLPILPEFVLLAPAVGAALESNLQLRGRILMMGATLLSSVVTTTIVFLLSYLGDAAKARLGLSLRAGGLLLALIVPMVLFGQLRAQAEITGQSFSIVVNDHIHLVALSFAAAVVSALIYATATKIGEALDALRVLRRIRRCARRREKAAKRRNACEQDAQDSVDKELPRLQAVEAKGLVQYTYELNHRRIVDYLDGLHRGVCPRAS